MGFCTKKYPKSSTNTDILYFLYKWLCLKIFINLFSVGQIGQMKDIFSKNFKNCMTFYFLNGVIILKTIACRSPVSLKKKLGYDGSFFFKFQDNYTPRESEVQKLNSWMYCTISLRFLDIILRVLRLEEDLSFVPITSKNSVSVVNYSDALIRTGLRPTSAGRSTGSPARRSSAPQPAGSSSQVGPGSQSTSIVHVKKYGGGGANIEELSICYSRDSGMR